MIGKMIRIVSLVKVCMFVHTSKCIYTTLDQLLWTLQKYQNKQNLPMNSPIKSVLPILHFQPNLSNKDTMTPPNFFCATRDYRESKYLLFALFSKAFNQVCYVCIDFAYDLKKGPHVLYYKLRVNSIQTKYKIYIL